eukprot:TRINITY_DN48140_c0_g1_i1.p1 TRINITY_DN48140_c0_g1~~TRINITY_DN48140_c0_g1_i1.p1  ORF type:complete len:316 (+),score=51.02 TRINITY_DN48140_c0_g1_i1:46-993(+)
MATPHLAESTLHKEDVLALGHKAVWGSFWEPLPESGASGRWGYACCKTLDRRTPCPHAAFDASNTQDSVEDEEDKLCEVEFEELLTREAFNGPLSAFVRHVVLWLLREWRRSIDAQRPEVTKHSLFREPSELQKATSDLEPLLALLVRVERRIAKEKRMGISGAPKVLTERDDWECPHCKYMNIGERTQCRKCKRDDENYVEPDEFPKFEEQILQKVSKVVELAATREYTASTEAFLDLTIGNGRWNSDVMALTGGGHAPTRKARSARDHMKRQAAAMAPMDSDEGKSYLRSLKRLVTLAQLLRPSPEASKNVHL